MITQKFNCLIPIEVIPYITEFNKVLRFGYNRLIKDKSLSKAEQNIKEVMNNIDLMDSSFVKMAVNKSKSLITKEEIVVFGGKKNFTKRSANKISKEEWITLRDPSILLRGSSSDNSGNRKAKLDIENNRIIFKPSRNIAIPIILPNLSKKTRKDLLLLQKQCELNEACFSLEIGRTYVSIIYDETIVKDNYKQVTAGSNRILSIDLNPNYIGLVITDNKIIYKEIIDLSDLNKKNIATSKRKHEILAISKYIANLCIHYKCNLAIEKLSMKPKQHNKGKTFNRLVNNYWNRNVLINNLKKRISLCGLQTFEILCAYTSFVGQMRNIEEYDSVAAAIEIGVRGLAAQRKQKYEILPKLLDLSQLSNHWKKEIIANGINTWLEFYNFLKKSKTSYRHLFTRAAYLGSSNRIFSDKSLVLIHRLT